MLSVDDNFKNACIATVRRPVAKLVFDVLDITTFGEGTTTTSGSLWWSDPNQSFDRIRDMSQKFCTWEKDYIALDGTFSFPAYVHQQRGWWSDTLSDASRVFSVEPWIKRTFSSDHSSVGISVTFDTTTGEVASDFRIDVLNGAGAAIYTNTVTGNALTSYIWETGLVDYRAVLVTIQKTSLAYRRVRIAEIDFGIIKTYTEKEIVSMTVNEFVDPTNKEVRANKLEVQLENKNKLFNPLNPSGIYEYLQRKQKLYPYVGFNIGGSPHYVPLGIFYLSENKSDQGALTATLTAYDLLDMLSQNTYRKGVYEANDLYVLAAFVLGDAGIDSSEYEIDANLAYISCTSAIPWLSHRDALQLIAMAGQAVIYVDRVGKLIIKQLTTTDSGVTIDYDNVSDVPEVKLRKIVNTIDTSVYTFQQEASTSEAYKGTVEISGTENVWVAYKDMYLSTGASYSMTAGTVNAVIYYAYGAFFNITHTGTITITVTAYKLVSNASQLIVESASKPAEEDSLVASVKNQLITSTSHARDVANWLLVELEQRLAYSANDRMKPYLECGDIVTIQDDFSANKKARISSQKFEYDGSLSGLIEATGEVI